MAADRPQNPSKARSLVSWVFTCFAAEETGLMLSSKATLFWFGFQMPLQIFLIGGKSLTNAFLQR